MADTGIKPYSASPQESPRALFLVSFSSQSHRAHRWVLSCTDMVFSNIAMIMINKSICPFECMKVELAYRFVRYSIKDICNNKRMWISWIFSYRASSWNSLASHPPRWTVWKIMCDIFEKPQRDIWDVNTNNQSEQLCQSHKSDKSNKHLNSNTKQILL